jgi:magnesium chelatase family protein
MVARVQTVAFQGVDTIPVEVQVHCMNGLPAFTVVGLADKAVAESRERIRAALTSLGIGLPAKRITANLTPADLVKEGAHFDLPIALALLMEMDVLPRQCLDNALAAGELSLDGGIRKVPGILPAAVAAAADGKGIVCPEENQTEAHWGAPKFILAASGLMDLIQHLKGQQPLPQPQLPVQPKEETYPDLSDIQGQETARRALEIAAAGGHNLLMSGPPGAGKSMLASRLPGILPPPTAKESLEISMILSIAGQMEQGHLARRRPYRDPHHSISMPAMVGGGAKAKPGEVTLAHRGVLFLDELPEFPRQALDSLRQPLETGAVSIARAQNHVTYPARFQLVAAMNPCRCGYLDTPTKACSKAPRCGSEYQSRISGPLLDRFDIQIEIPALGFSELHNQPKRESSATVRERVTAARNLQEERQGTTNAEATVSQIEQHAMPDDESQQMLERAMEHFGLTMRGYHRILRVARTIADSEGSVHTTTPHFAEAIRYRTLLKR